MNDLLDAPADFESKIQRYTFSIASTILYGWRTVSSEQTIVQKMMVVSTLIHSNGTQFST